MFRVAHTTLAVSLLCLTTAFAPALQERTKKKQQAKTFPVHLTEAKAAWDGGRLGDATASLQDALKLINKARHKAVLEAFPNLGETWKFEASKYDEGAAAMMLGVAGFNVEGNYRGEGKKRISVTATMDSPMVQMMAPMMANPAFLGDDAEIIKYGDKKALLQKTGDTSWDLTIVLDENVVQANARGMSDDDLLGIFNQSVVDGFASAMGR